MKKKYSKVSGMGDGLLEDILYSTLPGVGLIIAHEVKGMSYITKMATNADGTPNTNYPWIVNGLGIVAGVGLPMLVSDPEMKKYLKPIAAGIASQCIYSLYLTKAKNPPAPTINAGWKTYALGKEKTYALGCVKDANGNIVYQAPPDNAANPSPQQVTQQMNPGLQKQIIVKQPQNLQANMKSMAPAKIIAGSGF